MTVLLPMDLAIAKSTSYPLVDMLVLSYSSLSTFRSCARKFEFRQLYGTPPKGDDNYAGDVGKAIHNGFGQWLVTGNERKAVVAFGRSFPYDEEFLKPGNGARSMEAAYSTLMQLIRSDKLRQYEVAQINTKMGLQYAVEVPFAIRIVGAPIPIPVYYVGFIDCVLYDHIHDSYIATDLKTTRQHFQDPSALYEFDEQTVPYGIILEHALGKPIDEFETMYFHCFIDLLESTFNTYPYTKTREHVHDWYRGLCDDIARMGKYYEGAWWPRAIKGDTCMSYNKVCFHKDYCTYRDPAQITRMIGGEVRKNLFSTGEEPWIVAELQYLGG